MYEYLCIQPIIEYSMQINVIKQLIIQKLFAHLGI